jgi:hypothetical protein
MKMLYNRLERSISNNNAFADSRLSRRGAAGMRIFDCEGQVRLLNHARR